MPITSNPSAGFASSRVLLASICTIASLSFAVPPHCAAERPHIVVLFADDLGVGDIGCYGGKVAPTPNIDRLAREGTRFTRYYSAAPICSPSRCGLITGMFPARWRITSFLQTRQGNRGCEQADFLDPAAPSLPRALKASGYATAHIGKWHLGGGRDVENPPKFAAYGYDEGVGTWESPEPHPDITATDWIWSDRDKVKRWNRTAFFVDKTLDFIARHKDRPCFINLWLDDPHTPWVPEPAAGEQPNAKAKKAAKAANLRKQLVPVLVELDRQVGRLMDAVPANTLLFFISDNGPLPTFQGDRTNGLRGSKLSLYEGGIRLPFIARWPGQVPAGRVDDTTVLGGVDLFPTLCAMAGAKLPDEAALDGTDVSSTLRGQPVLRQRPLLWEYGRNNETFAYPPGKDRSPNVAILDGKWKLLINADGTGAELYDLAADPNETTDVSADNREITDRLIQQALTWRKSLPGPVAD